jgi:hypothetical protein
LEGHAVVVVAKIDAGKVLLLSVEIGEAREVVDRFQDGDEGVLQRQVDIGPPLEVASST